jgi:hypothetical protein
LEYNAYGIGTVRDPIVTRDQMLVYQTLWERGGMTLRCRPMFLIPRGSNADRIADITSLGVRSGFGDDLLKIWGLKAVMDGGAAAAALDQPYEDEPNFAGNLFWKVDELAEVANFAVRRGWRIGIHAIGDRAVRTTLDAYEQVVNDNPGLKPGTLVIEHAFLIDAVQRARAMLEEGVQISAGTDSTGTGAPSYDPMLGIWGMVTRGTKQVGIQGPEYAIDRYSAVQLYTAANAQFHWESDRRGTIQPRKLADLVAYRTDPMTCPIDGLLSLRPAFTIVGGRAVYDVGPVCGSHPPLAFVAQEVDIDSTAGKRLNGPPACTGPSYVLVRLARFAVIPRGAVGTRRQSRYALVHPLAGSVAAHAYAAIALFYNFRIIRDAFRQFRDIDAMPVRSREESDTNCQGGADLGAIEWQSWWKVIRNPRDQVQVQQERKYKDGQFDHTGNVVGCHFTQSSFTKGDRQADIQQAQKKRDPQRDRDQQI